MTIHDDDTIREEAKDANVKIPTRDALDRMIREKAAIEAQGPTPGFRGVGGGTGLGPTPGPFPGYESTIVPPGQNKQQSVIAEEIQATAHTINELQQTIRVLEQKLTPVRRISPPVPTETTGPESIEPVLVSEQIAALRAGVTTAIRTLTQLINELEV